MKILLKDCSDDYKKGFLKGLYTNWGAKNRNIYLSPNSRFLIGFLRGSKIPSTKAEDYILSIEGQLEDLDSEDFHKGFISGVYASSGGTYEGGYSVMYVGSERSAKKVTKSLGKLGVSGEIVKKNKDGDFFEIYVSSGQKEIFLKIVENIWWKHDDFHQ